MIKYCNTKNTAQYKLDGTVLDLASLSYVPTCLGQNFLIWPSFRILNYKIHKNKNRIGGVVVSMLASGVVDCGFKP
jgi:hypothetical protein